MENAQPRTLERPVWYGDEVESPELPEEGEALVFEVGSATGPDGETRVLYGGVRAETELAEMYGGRIAGAALIIAIDELTGAVHHAVPERMDSAPVEPVLHPPGALEQMDAVTSAIHSHFNVDLCTHLALPPEEGRYRVLLLLDALCSQAKTVAVPAADVRSPVPVEPTLGAAVLGFGSHSGTPELEPGRLQLASGAKELPTRPNGVRVLARIDPDLLTEDDAGQVLLTALLRGHLDRELEWVSWRVPASQLEASDGAFWFEPFRKAHSELQPQRWFAALVVGTAVGAAMVVERPQ